MPSLPPSESGVNREPLELGRARRGAVLAIAEDEMRARILEISPELRHDVRVMADLIRELVDTQRLGSQAKNLGAEVPGKIRLSLYPDKVPRAGIDPSYVGSLRLGARSFLVRAWLVKGGSAINLELKMI